MRNDSIDFSRFSFFRSIENSKIFVSSESRNFDILKRPAEAIGVFVASRNSTMRQNTSKR